MRSGPDLRRLKMLPPDPALKKGRRYLVGYVGVMGRQEGIDGLLDCGSSHRARAGPRATFSSAWSAAAPSCAAMRKLAAGAAKSTTT